jgi:hypothetical protein
MGAGDIAHERQSQARSSTASGDEGVEQALADIERYAGPAVAHTKHECVIAVLRLHFDHASGRRILNGIENEIIKSTVYLFGIKARRGSRRRRWSYHELDTFAGGKLVMCIRGLP